MKFFKMSSRLSKGGRKKKAKKVKEAEVLSVDQCVCRICMSDLDGLENPLLAPCFCKGKKEALVFFW